MISPERLNEIAVWSRELSESEMDRACRGITERQLHAGAYLFHRGDRFDAWAGVISGIVKMSNFTSGGKAVSYTGLTKGGWFGEGSVLKDEPRQYDIIALRETRVALLNGPTFRWLCENSTPFNRFLVRQLNERLGQFIALLGHDRGFEATTRLARCIAWLCNPVLSPGVGNRLEISQEELGLLSGLSRQMANRCLKVLEEEGLVRVEPDGIGILDLDGLKHFGE
ncbi:CRP-like cAMP-binding protein [Tepidamorphus gemmatus]|uniref:CRP-like cAMP-binding protein n=1 Tax=Tepidamorphus gemmatus TaxID=747076 RepID=A0A4R3MLE4_9HYPH|nr:Crp/Fnr family transcriptional regulator [Tepidamorphus gemmatus]TCT13250.1 CRP-like cAMP-binding protein [Tepidamorphus gemmatus]